MRDIVKEIRVALESGSLMERGGYFRKETLVDRKFFLKEILERYPNVEFVRIFMKKSEWRYAYQESYCESKYYYFSAFIDRNVLEYISNDLKVLENNDVKIIDLTSFDWNKQMDLRNKIFRCCPILMAESSCFSDEIMERDRLYGVSKRDYGSLSDELFLCPYCYRIDGYDMLNSTDYVLISNSVMISQVELDELCLSILVELVKENGRVIKSEKEIFVSISEKLKDNGTFTLDERMILDEFISSEIGKIEKKNTLLVRSRALSGVKR